MNIQLTLVTVLGLSSLIASGMFLILSTYATRMPGIRLWAAASGLIGLGMFVDHPLGDSPLASLIMNLLVACGQVLYLAGILQFCRQPIPRRTLWSLAATFLLFALIPNAELRVFLLTLLLGGVHLACAWVLWRHPESSSRRVYRGTSVIMGLHGLTTAAQGLALPVDPSLANQVSLWGAIVGTQLSTWLLFLLVMLRLLAELREAAERDALTGLLNRRGLRRQREALTSPPGHGRAALLLDIDHFKAINDRHGHEVGDEVLALMGEVLRSTPIAHALACRWGGEEFCVLLGCRDAEEATAVAERIRTRFHAESRRVARLPHGATVSIGVAWAPPPAPDDLAALIAAADVELYRAKAAGRDRVAGPGVLAGATG